MDEAPPYLVRLQLKEGVADDRGYPFSLPLIRCLDVEFTSPVTFFVGENGTGKSAVLEAIALDARNADPEFGMSGDPYASYGGRSPHTRSHGEAFLSIIQHRVRSGLLLFDEPEAALSPQRQLALLAHMSALVAAGKSQFIIATHSPILLTFPGAQILSFDGDTLHPILLADTPHFQITKGILQNPNAYWKHLQEVGTVAVDELGDAEPPKSKTRRNRRAKSV